NRYSRGARRSRKQMEFPRLHARPGRGSLHRRRSLLTHRAERSGYHPEVILAGRRMNDAMGAGIARQCVRMIMKGNGQSSSEACVTVLGLTFKENVPDIRNSKVVDIVRELQGFGIPVQAHDPIADPKDAQSEYGISLVSRDALQAGQCRNSRRPA